MRRVLVAAALVAVACAALAQHAVALPPGLGGDAQPKGNIRIVQDTGPDDPQVFTFDQSGSSNIIPSTFTLTDNNGDDAIGEFDTSVDYTGIPAGMEISITQRAVAGWPLTDLHCTLEDAQGGAAGGYDFDLSARNVTLTIFEDYTWECRFRNDDRRGSIRFVEDTVPSDTQPFAFTGDLGDGPTSFDGIPSTNVFFLSGDGDSRTFSNLAAGTYTVAQSTFNTGPDSGPFPSSGWDSTAISCNTGEAVNLATRTVTITLAELENVTCTFTNTQRPSITIVQDSIVSTGQDFSFGGTLGSFSLDDDGDATLSNSKTFLDVTPGSHTVSEALPSGYQNAGLSCTGGSPVVTGTSVTFTIASAQRITCTFTSGRPGSITFSKVLDGFDIEDPQDFAFATTGTGLSDFVLDVDSSSATPSFKKFDNLSPGTYTATEAALPGWKVVTNPFSSGGDCALDATQRKLSINLGLEQHAQCYVTNTDRGSISMTSYPATSPVDPASDIFQVHATGDGVSDSNFRIDAGAAWPSLHPGTYRFTFDEPPGWTITGITCSGTDVYDSFTKTLTITLDALENMTCSIVSSDEGGSITILANPHPDAGPLPATNFGAFGTIQGGQSAPVSGFTLDTDSATATPDSITFSDLPGGVYTFTESVPAGWRLGYISCYGYGPEETDLANRFGRVTVEPDENVTCYFSNTQTAALHIVNDATPDSSEEWDLTIDDGNGYVLDTTIDGMPGGAHGYDYANPGTYTVTLGPKSGWNLTGLSCSTGEQGNLTSRSVSVTLSATEEATCTFTNVRPAKITVVESSLPDDAQDFSYSGTLGAFSLDDDSNGALPATREFSDLNPGTFTVTQGAVTGWDTALSCTGGEPTDQATRTATIALTAGEQITCTFTNTRRGSITVVQDSRPDSAQDFSFATTVGAFPLDDDAEGTLPATSALSDLSAGPYTVSQGSVPGWDLTDLACTRTGGTANESVSLANRTATITLDPGEHVTCTFQTTQRGSITVVEDSVPDGAQDFSYSGTLGAFPLDDDADGALAASSASTNLVPGPYVVSQGAVPGWDLTDLTCTRTGGTANESIGLAARTATLTLDPGEQLTCTFQNTERGRITIVQQATPKAGDAFPFTGDLGPFTLRDDTNPATPDSASFFTVLPGRYDVTQQRPSGWWLDDVSCVRTGGVANDAASVATASVALFVDPGEQLTCTFASVAYARITVSVDASPDNAADFAFTGDLGPFALDDDADGTLDRSHLFDTLKPGTYSIQSTPTPGWTLTGLGCSGPHGTGVRTVTVTVAPGDDVSCAFTSTLDPVPPPVTGGGTPGAGSSGGTGGGTTTSDIGSAGSSASVFDGLSPTLADGSLTTADAGDLPSSGSQASAPKDGDPPSGAPSPDVGGFPAWWLALVGLGLLPLLLYLLRRWHAT